jgi:transposase
MRVYVGMDVHCKRSQMALLDEHGGQLLNRNLANNSAELASLLGRLEPGTPVAFEAAYGWGWLSCWRSWSRIWSTRAAVRRSPRPGSRRPGRCPHPGPAAPRRAVARAWIAPQAVRDRRSLLGHRAALVRTATALKCRVHAILADRGVRVKEPL